MVEVRSISKRFGELLAVDEVSFVAREGEIFGLIGPNGAGKSTTIKMVVNILAPDSGEILFGGSPMRERDKERIGYLPEERGLYPRRRVNEMLLYLAELKGKGRRESQPVIDDWLERFGLTPWKHRKIEELSKGMAQKVQFVAAVAHDPELLLLDEPFTGLDPVSADLLLGTMLELSAKGKTVLLSTHLMEHAERICSHILLIDRGRGILSGGIAEVKERYGRNSVVVEFDGDIDFVRELPYVTGIVRYPRWVEVELSERGAHRALFEALAGRVSVSRFELVAPSLHRIFMKVVAGEGEAARRGAGEGGTQ